MRTVASALALALTLASAAFSQTDPASLKGNVTRIDAGASTGFGFIVGMADRALLVATAWHTLRDLTTDTVTVCFAHRGETCDTGTVVYVADAIGSQPALDLAIVRTPYPEGLMWRPDALGTRPMVGDPVRFIGRSRDWYIPEDAGRAGTVDAAKQAITYTGLEVAEGVSGAPIVSANGIVAMHVESVGGQGEARGVDVHAIRTRIVEGLRVHWVLVPSAQCAQDGAHGRVLTGRDIVVHVDARQPAAGLDAIARLNCLGARALPRPVWSGEPWPGNGVMYSSGELRTARTVQSVLAPLGRLDTRLGDTDGGVAVWVR